MDHSPTSAPRADSAVSFEATRRGRRSPLLALLAVVLALGACNANPSATASPAASGSTTSPTATLTPVPTESSEASPSSSAGAAVSPPTQTDTAWGRIWDALPPSFPVFPGAQSAPDTTGAASATVTTPTDVTTVTTWLVDSLERAGFQATASPALEGGAHVIDASAAGGCKAQVQVSRQGSLTNIVTLYGASCPFS